MCNINPEDGPLHEESTLIHFFYCHLHQENKTKSQENNPYLSFYNSKYCITRNFRQSTMSEFAKHKNQVNVVHQHLVRSRCNNETLN